MKVGNKLGNILDFPKYMHGVGCGFSDRLGVTGRQTLIFSVVPLNSKPVKTYPAGRRCQVCGCVLSIYNPSTLCSRHDGSLMKW